MLQRCVLPPSSGRWLPWWWSFPKGNENIVALGSNAITTTWPTKQMGGYFLTAHLYFLTHLCYLLYFLVGGCDSNKYISRNIHSNSRFFCTVIMWKKSYNYVQVGFIISMLIMVQLHQQFSNWWKRYIQQGSFLDKKYTKQNAVLTETI
jgi:hypothetical protein